MNRQKIGQILYWLGVVGLLINIIVQLIRSPFYRVSTAAELSGTFWDPNAFQFLIIGQSAFWGLGFTIIGALLSSGKKSSRFWLWGIVPLIAMTFLMVWSPSQHLPPLYGIGGGIITIAYLGSLWVWVKTHTAYEGSAKTGKQIQLLGYSFLYMAALFLCIFLGTPNLPALADITVPGAESILVSLSVGILLLFVGDFVARKRPEEAPASQQVGLKSQPGATD
jgi:hypothetical protein